MNARDLLSVIIFALLLTGCAAPASRDAMDIPATDRAKYSTDHFLSGKVTVGSVIGGQDTNPAWTSEIGNADFEAALRNSLETAYLLSSHSTAEYILDAELIEINQPMFGFTFNVDSKIRYTLRNAVSRQTEMEETVTATGTATSGEAFVGTTRLRMATERSAQTNISKLIDALYSFSP